MTPDRNVLCSRARQRQRRAPGPAKVFNLSDKPHLRLHGLHLCHWPVTAFVPPARTKLGVQHCYQQGKECERSSWLFTKDDAFVWWFLLSSAVATRGAVKSGQLQVSQNRKHSLYGKIGGSATSARLTRALDDRIHYSRRAREPSRWRCCGKQKLGSSTATRPCSDRAELLRPSAEYTQSPWQPQPEPTVLQRRQTTPRSRRPSAPVSPRLHRSRRARSQVRALCRMRLDCTSLRWSGSGPCRRGSCVRILLEVVKAGS